MNARRIWLTVAAVTLAVPPGPPLAASSNPTVTVVNAPSNPVPVASVGTTSVSGSVSVLNLPSIQPVSGVVTVGNLPSIQNVNVVNAGSAPSAPSDLVTLTNVVGSDGSTCAALDQRVSSDGTVAAFDISPGKVLIATEVQCTVFGEVGAFVTAAVEVLPSGASQGFSVARRVGMLDEKRFMEAVMPFSVPFALRPGARMCCRPGADFGSVGFAPTMVLLRGYLADDR